MGWREGEIKKENELFFSSLETERKNGKKKFLFV